MTGHRVMVVDDEPGLANALAINLRAHGWDVVTAPDGGTALALAALSSRLDGQDKIDALDAGADDYVTKPFAMNELLARLRAAVRRAAPGDVSEAIVEAGELMINLAHRRVLRHGQAVPLSPTEWALIEVLVRNRGKLVGRQQLLEEVWGPAHPRHIITQPGMGYIFETS